MDMAKLPTPPKAGNTTNNPMIGSLPSVPPPVSTYGPGLGTKEREFLAQQDETALEEVRKELEVAPEVSEAGVEVKREEIELPPPLPKIGVTQTGAELPVSPTPFSLPITDDKIVTGTGAPVISSLRWLVEWCLRQLKKIHIKLKKVHGRITRVVVK